MNWNYNDAEGIDIKMYDESTSSDDDLKIYLKTSYPLEIPRYHVKTKHPLSTLCGLYQTIYR